MKTMVRDPDNDYDIDEGVYFRREDLLGDRGAEMTPLQARQMVRDAVDDGKFKRAPEVRSNCMLVFYDVKSPAIVGQVEPALGEHLLDIAVVRSQQAREAMDPVTLLRSDRTVPYPPIRPS